MTVIFPKKQKEELWLLVGKHSNMRVWTKMKGDLLKHFNEGKKDISIFKKR